MKDLKKKYLIQSSRQLRWMIEALLMSLIYGLQIHLIKENLLNIE